jgi:hypothetical protein
VTHRSLRLTQSISFLEKWQQAHAETVATEKSEADAIAAMGNSPRDPQSLKNAMRGVNETLRAIGFSHISNVSAGVKKKVSYA